MKEYERPLVGIIDFSAEMIMDDNAGAGQGPGSMDDGVSDLPPMP